MLVKKHSFHTGSWHEWETRRKIFSEYLKKIYISFFALSSWVWVSICNLCREPSNSNPHPACICLQIGIACNPQSSAFYPIFRIFQFCPHSPIWNSLDAIMAQLWRVRKLSSVIKPLWAKYSFNENFFTTSSFQSGSHFLCFWLPVLVFGWWTP